MPRTIHTDMAQRDLTAAVHALENGQPLAAVVLALDAVCSLTAEAAEGSRDMEQDSATLGGNWRPEFGRQIAAKAKDALELAGTGVTWWSIRDLRNAVNRAQAARRGL